MSPIHHNLDQPAKTRRPRTRSDSRCAKEGEFVSSKTNEQIQGEVGGELNEIPRFDFNSSEFTERVQ